MTPHQTFWLDIHTFSFGNMVLKKIGAFMFWFRELNVTFQFCRFFLKNDVKMPVENSLDPLCLYSAFAGWEQYSLPCSVPFILIHFNSFFHQPILTGTFLNGCNFFCHLKVMWFLVFNVSEPNFEPSPLLPFKKSIRIR